MSKLKTQRLTLVADFDSSFANLFQFYDMSGAAPDFETVQFLRKGLLILALTWFSNNPLIQRSQVWA